MKWKVFFASATGKYHLDQNLPCQDAGNFLVVEDILIGVVCDGAGSSSEGQVGSDFFSRTVTELISESVKAKNFTTETHVDYREYLLPIIQASRLMLEEMANTVQIDIRQFACTLVGCLLTKEGGCFFHIGDGYAIYLSRDGESLLSKPENGEYADETYFVTDEYWKDHLRVTPIPSIKPGGVIGLMSDGASPFVVDKLKKGFFRPFIDPVVTFLSNSDEHKGNLALKNLLESEQTFAITQDDKTLLLALVS